MATIKYWGKQYPLNSQAQLTALLSMMTSDIEKIGQDTSTNIQRLDTHQAALQGGGAGGSPVAALLLAGRQGVALPGFPATGSSSPAQLQESDAPSLGTQVILDAQAIPPAWEGLAAAASVGTGGSVAIGTANTAQKMSDTAHVIAVTLGSGGTNGTIGYLGTVKSGKPYPAGRIPIVNVGQNKLGLRTQQSLITQDSGGYIHYPLFIPGTLITGTDEVPVTMIA